MVRTFETHKIRPQQELDGVWEFRVNEDRALKVVVPSCWETYPGYGKYQGKAIYSRRVFGGGNLRLAFEGVSHTADVFLDGKWIAHHYNAYTAFQTVVPDVKEGEHLLTVEVDNAFGGGSSLHIPNDYYTFGGINRPVTLEKVPDVYIKWVHLTPVKTQDGWRLEIETELENISGNARLVTVKTSLEDAECVWEQTEIEAKGYKCLRGTIKGLRVKEYELDDPQMYLVNTTLSFDGEVKDDLIERVGFREIRVKGKQILLNDKPVQIRGFCRHEGHPLFGCALPPSAMDYDLNLIEDMGGNAVRTSHYPNDQYFLDLCDEKGIMVWEENHARGLSEIDMRNPYFDVQCKNCIDEMIRDHFNHPSIIIWGILNECASETEYGRECYKRQFAQIKSLDGSRPTSFASCKHYKDLCMDLPDIISYNIYPRWYEKISTEEYFDTLYQWVQTTAGAGKPFLITEIGAGAVYGYRDPHMEKWTEDFQEWALEEQIGTVLSKEMCSGMFIWQFCDARVSTEWFMNRPRSMNNKGVVDEYRRPKLAYKVVKKLYHELKK